MERRFLLAGAKPARQLSLQPVAVGAVQGGKDRIRVSNCAHEINHSMPARNFSRRVTRFLALYSRSVNVRYDILYPSMQ